MTGHCTELHTSAVNSAWEAVIGRPVEGATVTSAAGVGRRTVYYWYYSMERDAVVVAYLNRARWEYRERLRSGLEDVAVRSGATLSIAPDGECKLIRRNRRKIFRNIEIRRAIVLGFGSRPGIRGLRFSTVGATRTAGGPAGQNSIWAIEYGASGRR
jgi:hypothetical protein